jgi:hypothetical protein
VGIKIAGKTGTEKRRSFISKIIIGSFDEEAAKQSDYAF